MLRRPEVTSPNRKRAWLGLLAVTGCIGLAFLTGLFVVGPQLSAKRAARVTALLPTSSPSPIIATAAPQTSVLRRQPATAPRPASAAPVASTADLSASRSTVTRPGPAGPVATRPSPDHGAGEITYVVRIQTYDDQQSADLAAAQLAKQGFTASVRRSANGNDITYTLYTPAYATRADAEVAADTLRQDGFPASAVPSD